MPDTPKPRETNRAMSSVRRKDTGPELLLRDALEAEGVRNWAPHAKDLPGEPDLAFMAEKVAVFVDGAFWHGHPDYPWKSKNQPVTNRKIERTKERDRKHDAELAALGWRVVRLWDFDIEGNPRAAARRVIEVLRDS